MDKIKEAYYKIVKSKKHGAEKTKEFDQLLAGFAKTEKPYCLCDRP